MTLQTSPKGTEPKHGALIGAGRTAEVFAVGNDRVLKLFRAGVSRETIQRELLVARQIGKSSLPAPAVYLAPTPDGLVEEQERCGILYSRIDGSSMLHAMSTKPWRVLRYAVEFANLHEQLHAHHIPGLPRQRDRLEGLIEKGCRLLPPTLVTRILAALDSLPDQSAVCHGDLHPDNILLTPSGPRIIDWEPAGQGCPAADIAWTAFLLKHGGVPPNIPLGVRVATSLLRQVFLSVYLRRVFRIGRVTREDLKHWMPIIAAARLGDGIDEERDALLRIISRGFPAPQPKRM